MMFSRALTLLSFAFVPFVLAEGNLTGLLQALDSSGLDQFSNATASLNSTAIGQEVLTRLSEGNDTIFAPSDDAWSRAANTTVNNETSLANAVAYHIVPGNFINQTQTYPNVTIGRTLLNDSSLVMLEGNRSQVLVWSKFDNGTLFVMNQGSNTTVVNSTTYNGTAILAIDSVLTPPPNISTILNDPSYNLSLVATILNYTAVVNGPTILEALSSAHGVTLFAPNNAGIQAAQSSLAGLSNNATALAAVVANHIINGTSVYSTEFLPGNHTSAGGQNFAFAPNSTGWSVSVGGSNQVQIVEPNVLTSNGVIHIVNGVMFDTNIDAAAASSAYASATFVAAHVSQTGPVSAISTSPPTAATTSPTTTTTSGVAAKGGADDWMMALLVGMGVGLGPFF